MICAFRKRTNYTSVLALGWDLRRDIPRVRHPWLGHLRFRAQGPRGEVGRREEHRPRARLLKVEARRRYSE